MLKKKQISIIAVVYHLLFPMFLCMSATVWGQSMSQGKNFYIGIDNTGDKCKSGEFFNSEAMDSLGVDFVVYHYHGPTGTVKDEVEKMKALGESFAKKGLKVIVNTECGNWSESLVDKDGNDWVKQPDGLHLFKFPHDVLVSLNQSNAVWGIQYDELEHSQITRNVSLTIENPSIKVVSLAETNGMTFTEADDAVCKGAKSLVAECKADGTNNVFSENVWPVLYHNFARAGMIPVYKQMKEGWSNVWAACAMGACLQYDKDLCACLDLWNHDVFPGHSAAELRGNLYFSYWAGADKAYVEAIGKHTYVLKEDGHIVLKERGKVFSDFTHKYLPANPRPYTFRDYQPEIAIIRFDDTDWGQANHVYSIWANEGDTLKLYWPDWLFGAYNLNRSDASEEWIRAWNTITHGWVKKNSLSWANYEAYKDMPHRSFAPANAPIVYDQTVTRKYLETVKLVFLCGLQISRQTISDVTDLVREKGLTVVTSVRFAPERFAKRYSDGIKEFKDGKGRWILTDDMASDELKNRLNPFLGHENEIIYNFKGNRTVRMEISPDGNELQIFKNF